MAKSHFKLIMTKSIVAKNQIEIYFENKYMGIAGDIVGKDNNIYTYEWIKNSIYDSELDVTDGYKFEVLYEQLKAKFGKVKETKVKRTNVTQVKSLVQGDYKTAIRNRGKFEHLHNQAVKLGGWPILPDTDDTGTGYGLYQKAAYAYREEYTGEDYKLGLKLFTELCKTHPKYDDKNFAERYSQFNPKELQDINQYKDAPYKKLTEVFKVLFADGIENKINFEFLDKIKSILITQFETKYGAVERLISPLNSKVVYDLMVQVSENQEHLFDNKVNPIYYINDINNAIFHSERNPWRNSKLKGDLQYRDYEHYSNFIDYLHEVLAEIGFYKKTGELANYLNQMEFDKGVRLYAEGYRSNEILNYFKDLHDNVIWDKKERINHVLQKIWPNSNYEVGQYENIGKSFKVFMIGAARRFLHPGSKQDYVLTLCGNQGKYKSTFVEYLACDKKYYVDGSTMDLRNIKDAELIVRRGAICEISELSSFTKSEMASVKAFITNNCPTIRLPYDKGVSSLPRYTSMIATTNELEWSHDSENRRFILFEVSSECNIKELNNFKNEIKQIWAEAFYYLNRGDDCHLGNADLKLLTYQTIENRKLQLEPKGLTYVMAILDRHNKLKGGFIARSKIEEEMNIALYGAYKPDPLTKIMKYIVSMNIGWVEARTNAKRGYKFIGVNNG